MGKYDYRRLDDLIHSRVRLAIMSYLADGATRDFTEIKQALDVTDGNLSAHLTKLEDAQYVAIEKRFSGRRPQTLCQLTPRGLAAFSDYVERLAALIPPT
ncbi:MAG: transcriptional regulator [Pseudomonadota bacterium]